VVAGRPPAAYSAPAQHTGWRRNRHGGLFTNGGPPAGAPLELRGSSMAAASGRMATRLPPDGAGRPQACGGIPRRGRRRCPESSPAPAGARGSAERPCASCGVDTWMKPQARYCEECEAANPGRGEPGQPAPPSVPGDDGAAARGRAPEGTRVLSSCRPTWPAPTAAATSARSAPPPAARRAAGPPPTARSSRSELTGPASPAGAGGGEFRQDPRAAVAPVGRAVPPGATLSRQARQPPRGQGVGAPDGVAASGGGDFRHLVRRAGLPGACAVGRRLGGGMNNPLWPGLGHVRVWKSDRPSACNNRLSRAGVSPCLLAARAGRAFYKRRAGPSRSNVKSEAAPALRPGRSAGVGASTATGAAPNDASQRSKVKQ
jgi:hypothetical protein